MVAKAKNRFKTHRFELRGTHQNLQDLETCPKSCVVHIEISKSPASLQVGNGPESGTGVRYIILGTLLCPPTVLPAVGPIFFICQINVFLSRTAAATRRALYEEAPDEIPTANAPPGTLYIATRPPRGIKYTSWYFQP